MAWPFDSTVPNMARIYDCLLDGKDNFPADREAAARILQIEPGAARAAKDNRAFLGRVTGYLAGPCGIRQFLDIGTGLPAMRNVHEVAQETAPGTRVVYADLDPVVLAHARALLTSRPGGECDYIEADIRNPATILEAAARTLDFTRPVAVLLLGILHFLNDQDNPRGIVQRLMAGVPAGSYLAVSHATGDFQADGNTEKLAEVYAATPAGGVYPRPLAEIMRFFTGLELAGPGVVPVQQWRPTAEAAGSTGDQPGRALVYGGAGRLRGLPPRQPGQAAMAAQGLPLPGEPAIPRGATVTEPALGSCSTEPGGTGKAVTGTEPGGTWRGRQGAGTGAGRVLP